MPASPPSTSASSDDHVAEHIPWDHLTIQPPPDRRRLWYGAALAIVAMAVVIVVVRSFERPRPLIEPVLVDPSPAASVAPPVVPTVPASSLPPPTEPDLLSEADLMAVDPLRLERSVVTRAEAFVLEFFSLDPGDTWSARVAEAAGRPVADGIAPVGPDEATVSYVEWVSVYDVERRGSGRYAVEVSFRRLVAVDGVAYRRLPIEWVTVEVELDAGGVPRVGTLPVPTDGPMIGGEALTSSGRTVDAVGIDWPS